MHESTLLKLHSNPNSEHKKKRLVSIKQKETKNYLV